jgi:hypothetical protein
MIYVVSTAAAASCHPFATRTSRLNTKESRSGLPKKLDDLGAGIDGLGRVRVDTGQHVSRLHPLARSRFCGEGFARRDGR